MQGIRPTVISQPRTSISTFVVTRTVTLLWLLYLASRTDRDRVRRSGPLRDATF